MEIAKTTDCWSVVKSPFGWNIATAIMEIENFVGANGCGPFLESELHDGHDLTPKMMCWHAVCVRLLSKA